MLTIMQIRVSVPEDADLRGLNTLVSSIRN